MKKIQIGEYMSKKIKISKLKKIKNSKGDILLIKKFSKKDLISHKEIYGTWVKKNHIKGWNLHKKMTVRLIVLKGKIKFVFYDKNKNLFKSITCNDKVIKKIIVYPGIFIAMKNLSNEDSLILNIASLKHSKKEQIKLSINKIKYNW
tara:strand:- start:55 stop:495 length:441 start_codon:yes stop_codon:yes gene_type:complete